MCAAERKLQNVLGVGKAVAKSLCKCHETQKTAIENASTPEEIREALATPKPAPTATPPAKKKKNG